MTDEEFAAGVDQILASGAVGHASHRALDMLWTRYAAEKGGPLAEATRKWMAAVEGDHTEANPYPLRGLSWWQRPLRCKLGMHRWGPITQVWYAWSRDCLRCGERDGSGNPCP